MKKYSILMIPALAFIGLTSCEDAPAVAPIQENPQGPVISTSDFTIAPESVLSTTIDLDKYVDATEIALFNVSSSELPEGMGIEAVMQISDADNFQDTYDVNLTEKDGVYYVDPGMLQDAHVELMGDDNLSESTLHYRVYGYIYSEDNKAQKYRFGTDDYYMTTGTIKETPMVSIMPTDYLYTPGGFNGWSQTASQYMYPKVDGDTKEVLYYYGAINVEPEFKICQTPNWDVNWGAGADNKLVPGGDNFKATDGNGLYWITANIKDLTYTQTKINTISVIGGGDWDTDRNLTPNDDQTIWTGEINIDGEWKIRMNGTWDINYGGKLKSPSLDGDNFKGPETAGTVTVTINFKGHHPVITMK